MFQRGCTFTSMVFMGKKPVPLSQFLCCYLRFQQAPFEKRIIMYSKGREWRKRVVKAVVNACIHEYKKNNINVISIAISPLQKNIKYTKKPL